MGTSKARGGKLGCFGIVYLIGFFATLIYYLVANWSTCQGRFHCDAGSFFEMLLYPLIWPLHWLLEAIEAIF